MSRMRARRGRYTVLIPLLGASLVGVLGLHGARRWMPRMPSRRPTLWSAAISPVASPGQRTIPTTPRPSIAARSSTIPTTSCCSSRPSRLEVSRADWPRAFKLARPAGQAFRRRTGWRISRSPSTSSRTATTRRSEDHFKRAGHGPIGELTSALGLAWVKLRGGRRRTALGQRSRCRSRPSGRSFICAIIAR